MKVFVGLMIVIATLLADVAFAREKLLLLPVLGDAQRKLGNVVTVAKENGDFPDVLSAMDSIKDADINNPYLMIIGPGKYALTSTLKVKPYVSILGSGQQTTELVMVNPEDYALSYVESHVMSSSFVTFLSNLTVRHSGNDGTQCIALKFGLMEANVSNVTLIASGCSVVNTGISGLCGFAQVDNTTIKVSGGSRSIGISNCSVGGGQVKVKDSLITVSGSGYVAGVSSFMMPVNIEGSSISATNGQSSKGIIVKSIGTSPPSLIRDSTIFASSAGESIGIEFSNPQNSGFDSHTIQVRRSSVAGSSSSITGDNAIAYDVSHSTLTGSTSGAGNAAIKTCVFTDNGDGLALPSDCVAPVMKR